MASSQPVQSKKDATWHEGGNFMAYRDDERPGYENSEDDLDIEHAGVLHFVHGWIQQCQKAKVNYLFYFILFFYR